MLPFIVEMKIDEIDEYTLTNHAQNKKNKHIVMSVHRPLTLSLNLEFSKIKPQRVEYFNFKSEECRKKFKFLTDNTTKLSKCFENNLPAMDQAIMWQKTLEKIFCQSFKKRCITNSNKKSDLKSNKFLEERRQLMKKLAKNPTFDISARLSEIEAEIGVDNILMHASYVKNQVSQFNKSVATDQANNCWSLVRKIRPKTVCPVPEENMTV